MPNLRTASSSKSVATATFTVDYARSSRFYEAGAIYDHEPQVSWGDGARPLEAGEHVVACARCGQQFAGTDDGTAESWRDLHFVGDEDIPSICAPENDAAQEFAGTSANAWMSRIHIIR